MDESPGRKAFAAFKTAVETGDTGPLTTLADPGLRFLAPIPFGDWIGEQRGLGRLRELIAFERTEMEMDVTLTLSALFEDADRAVALFEADGVNKGGDYRNTNALSMDFAGGKLVRLVEYCAQVDPEAVKAVNG